MPVALLIVAMIVAAVAIPILFMRLRRSLILRRLRRPLGSDITDPEARHFFSRVGRVDFHGKGDKPIDFAALNRLHDELDRRFLAEIGASPTAKR
jgi:hypothetical protein